MKKIHIRRLGGLSANVVVTLGGIVFLWLCCFASSLKAQLPQSFTVTVDKGEGEMVELNLSKHSVRAENCRIVTWDSTNGYVDVHTAGNPAHPSRTYRGYVSENPNHLIMAVVHMDNTLQAEAHDGEGRVWSITGVDVSTELGNGTSDVPAPAPLAAGSGTTVAAGNPGQYLPPVGLYRAHGVEDIPSRFFDQQGGTVDSTLTWLEYQWNVFDYFNARDAKLSMELSEIIIRKEQFYFPDNGSYSQFNRMLRDEWELQGQNKRAFIHSWFPYNFSYAGGYNTGKNMYAAGGEAIAINALYHEVGHAWRCAHYYYGNETMTGNRPAHSELNTQNVLYTRQLEIDQDDGIELLTSYPTNIHPRAAADMATTMVDTAVEIAPMANDYDANGDVITLKYYTTNTAKGGTVTELNGVLTYTPANGYVGKDIIVYEVQDSAGLYTKGLINIEVINGGLAAHWDMEDSFGTQATDLSGNGHAGALVGADFATASIPGPVGQAIALTASQHMIGDDSNLILHPDTSYPLEDVASSFFDPLDADFSAAAWVKLQPGTNSAVLMSKTNKASFGYRILLDTATGVTAQIRVWDGLIGATTISAGTVVPDTWYHIAMVLDRAAEQFKLYINGQEVGSATVPDGYYIFNGREDLKIGGDIYGSSAGAIAVDDVRLYTKALSSGEVSGLYASGSVPAGIPSPDDGALAQSVTSTQLSWLAGQAVYQHDVYFGTNAAAVASATTASAEYRGRQSATTYVPTGLNYSTKYFWRIDEVDGSTIIPGSVWSFSTSATPITEQLVLHLTMDNEDVQVAEGVPHTYDDIAFPASDFATFDTVAAATTGIIGEALDLTATDDTLRSYGLNLVRRPSSGGVSLSFWLKTTSTNSSNEMVYSIGGAYFMMYNDGDLTPVFDGSSSGAMRFDTNINDGNWHHVVATNDGAGTTTLYIDGVSVGSDSESLFDVGSLNRAMAIGSEYSDLTGNMVASYDDFAVWQRTLSAAEVVSIHSDGLAGSSFNDIPMLVNTSFEATDGFTGFASGTSAFSSVTDSNGVVWDEIQDGRIWNRTDIPPDGVQVITLGNEETELGQVDVRIPGTDHGVGIVSFDYASYSGSTDATFRLLYSINGGATWTEAWSTHLSGDNPKYTVKPWPSAEVGINTWGDVDLRFESSGVKGAKFDNVKITGMVIPAGTPSVAEASGYVAENAAIGTEVLTVSASDPDVGDTLTYSITDGNIGGAFSIDDNGVIRTAAALDYSVEPSYDLTVSVTDNGGLWSSAHIGIAVNPADGVIFTDGFERAAGTDLGNSWIEQTNDSRIYDSSGSIAEHLISVNEGESFAVVQQLDARYISGLEYRLGWSATRGTTASGSINYEVALGTWDGSQFTPLESVTGTIGGLHKNTKVEGPDVNLVPTLAQDGQQVAIRLAVLDGSDNWAGYDDIELEITGAILQPYVAGLYAWYKGDDGLVSSGSSVSSWTNQAGTGAERDLNRVIGLPTTMNQSLTAGGHASVLRLDGAAGIWAAAGDFGSIDSDRTIFVYARLNDSSDGFLFDGTTSSGISRARVKGDQWQVGSRSSNNGGDDPVTGAASTGVWQLHAFQFDYNESGTDTLVSHWVDGVLLGSHSQSSQLDLGGLMLGADVSGSNHLTVDIAEVLVYDAALGTAERQTTRAYLESKWDGAADIPMSYVTETVSQDDKVIPSFGVHALSALKIETFGQQNPFDLTDVTFNLNGTTDSADVHEVRLYATGSSSTFNESNMIASQLVSGGAGSLSFSLSRTLIEGDNHFWLAVVPMDGAPNGNVIDAEILSFALNGSAAGTYNPVTPAPVERLTLGAGIYSQVLRKLGDDGVVKYRIPGLVTTNSGTLIAVFDNRNTSGTDLPGNIDVGMMRSTDNGINWSPMVAIMDHDHTISGSSGNGVGDPAVLVDKNSNRIWVMATHSFGNNSWNGSGPGLDPTETGQLEVVYSDDDGLTWTAPINITAQVKTDPNWHFVLQGPGNGITLRNGMIAFPLTVREIDGLRRSTFVVSNDNGATWHTAPFSVQAAGEAPATTESQIVELDDGTIMISMRNHDGRKRRAWATYSYDQAGADPLQAILNGSWTPSIPGGDNNDDVSYNLLDPRCQASFIRYSSAVDGYPYSMVLFSNPASSSSRVNMTVRASIDEGQTWPYARQIDSRPAAYSSMTRLADGSIGILYETGDAGSTDTLAFARFPLSYVIGESNAPIGTDTAESVAENMAVGTAVGKASFIELDQGQTLAYAITAGNTGGAFDVDSNGNISTAAVLDRDVLGLYTLTVTATDSAGVSGTATVTVTVTEIQVPPVFTNDPIVASGVVYSMPYSDTLAGSATDGNAVDVLTYSKISGPAWLSVASDGTLSGTPAGSDAGLNIFLVEVADGNGGTDQANLEINVSSSGVLFMEDFEAYDVENPSDFSVGGTATGNWEVSDTSSNATRIYDTSNFGGSRLWISNTDGTTLTSAGTPAVANEDYSLRSVLVTETSYGNRTLNAGYDILIGQTAATAVSLIGGPQAVVTSGDGVTTVNSKEDHIFSRIFQTGSINPGDQIFIRFERIGTLVTGGWFGVDDVQLSIGPSNQAPTVDDVTVAVAENLPANEPVVRLVRSDPDVGDQLSFVITAGNDAGLFAIDSNGQISTTAPLDHESASQYVLTVQVHDDGDPPLSDSATVTVNVTDVQSGDDSDGNSLNDNWEILHFGVTGSVAGTVDSDGDGLSNFGEMVFGYDPLENDAGTGPVGVRSIDVEGTPMLEFRIRRSTSHAEYAVDYRVQTNATLEAAGWQNSSELPVGVDDFGTYEHLLYHFPVPTETEGRLFLRCQVTPQ